MLMVESTRLEPINRVFKNCNLLNLQEEYAIMQYIIVSVALGMRVVKIYHWYTNLCYMLTHRTTEVGENSPELDKHWEIC